MHELLGEKDLIDSTEKLDDLETEDNLGFV